MFKKVFKGDSLLLLTIMSLSQHIPVIVEAHYLSQTAVDLSAIYHEIIANHYAVFLHCLELFGYSFGPLDTDIYYTYFGEHIL